MATNFPASLDTLTNPSATDTLDSPPHDEQHADANDAIEALQAKVGVDSSAVTTSLDYRVGQLETGGGGMTVSSTAPSSPAEGDMWYDDTSGRTYVYYDDGSSQQWVEFGAPPSGIGKILQVVSTTKTDTFSSALSAGGTADVTGLAVTITPTLASSTILLYGSVHGSNSTGPSNNVAWYFQRGSTAIGIGDTASTRSRITAAQYGAGFANLGIGNASMLIEDSPATTSATTYKITLLCMSGGTLYVNRTGADTDTSQYPRTVSSIIALEVSA